MTQIKPRKERIDLTIEQKLDDAKLMVHEHYTNKKNHGNIRSQFLSS